jgi:hypothetical protein
MNLFAHRDLSGGAVLSSFFAADVQHEHLPEGARDPAAVRTISHLPHLAGVKLVGRGAQQCSPPVDADKGLARYPVASHRCPRTSVEGRRGKPHLATSSQNQRFATPCTIFNWQIIFKNQS